MTQSIEKHQHLKSSLQYYEIADAPAIISVSSCVIEACLALLYLSDKSLIISSALTVVQIPAMIKLLPIDAEDIVSEQEEEPLQHK